MYSLKGRLFAFKMGVSVKRMPLAAIPDIHSFSVKLRLAQRSASRGSGAALHVGRSTPRGPTAKSSNVY